MRLACVTQHEVLDQTAWSKAWPGIGGACYHLTTALQRLSIPIDFLGPLKDCHTPLAPLKAAFYDRVLGKRYYAWPERSLLRYYARQISSKLSSSQADIVFCPTNARPIAYLDCKQPIVLWTDAPFSALIDFYDYLSNLSRETRTALLRMEAAALRRCARVIYSSEWAAETAIRDYTLNPCKVKVVHWGANLDAAPTDRDVRLMIDNRTFPLCKVLFVGMWWERKGGDVAVAVARQLNARGIPTELTVVGCESLPSESLPNFVRVVGFLDKSREDGRKKMEQLFAQSHFLILPSRADCTPLVVAEANAFGVPCLTSNVGGMAALVRDGSNGFKFPKEPNIGEYCDYIIALMRDRASYRRLAWSAFQEYQTRLNWTGAARATRDILADVVANIQHAP